jgi:CRP-like cAMP-binding protein
MSTTTPTAQEKQLEQLVKEGNSSEAVRLLCDMAVNSAQNNEFKLAEQYRDRLYEVDCMALSAIIAVNEAIESQKSKSLGPGHRELWHKFFDELSTEEANAFFLHLENVTVEPDETILEQGKPNDRLYLVNRGRLKIVYNNGATQQFIHQLESGDIFGNDTFFSVNVCTISVVALASSRLSCFQRADLEKLLKKHPFMAKNLEKICSSGISIYDRIRRKGIERRAHRRFNIQTKVRVQILTPNQANTLQHAFSAELWDVSIRGLSFFLHSKKKETVKKLTGRTLGVTILLKHGGICDEIPVTGVVHGVQDHPMDEYSVHLKLNREISHENMSKLNFFASQQDKQDK